MKTGQPFLAVFDSHIDNPFVYGKIVQTFAHASALFFSYNAQTFAQCL